MHFLPVFAPVMVTVAYPTEGQTQRGAIFHLREPEPEVTDSCQLM